MPHRREMCSGPAAAVGLIDVPQDPNEISSELYRTGRDSFGDSSRAPLRSMRLVRYAISRLQARSWM